MMPATWPLRLIPRRSPPFLTGLAISIAALGAAILLRGALLGWSNALSISATTFPALIVATLYAGPRWGWLSLATAVGLGLLSPLTILGVSTVAITGMFAVSAGLTVIVSSSLREAMLRLDEANAAQATVQRALVQTEAQFRALADSAPVLMWVSRTDGRRDFVNQAYVEFLGADYQAAVDLDWRKVLHPEDLTRVLQEQVAGEASRKLFTLEARFRHRDAEYRWVRSISQPRWGPDGEFAGFIGVGYDITEAKQAEADLKGINDLLAERVQAALVERDEAEAALQRAQKLEAVGQLTGGVAHDFNNLLTVVIGALDMMKRHPTDEPRRNRMIEAAMGAARRGERLTQQLLAFSRRQALKPEAVQVDALLKDTEPLLKRAVGEAVTLVLAPDAPEAVVSLDPSQFEAAIMNLALNARDATPSGGTIRIETTSVSLQAKQVEQLEAGHYLRVAVRDTGAGMDPAVVARAFEPFFTTKEPGRGTGLGLSQVYGFARQSGGTATVESRPGEGAVVCVYLPRIAADLLEPASEAPVDITEEGPKLRVLLAEDDAQVAELVEALLSDLGHQVHRTEHADAALVVLRTNEPIDLLLTDLIMPGDKSGVDLAREAVVLRPGLPVILSSGYTGDVLSAAKDTPWPLLCKPYGVDQLAQAIAAEIAKTPQDA